MTISPCSQQPPYPPLAQIRLKHTKHCNILPRPAQVQHQPRRARDEPVPERARQRRAGRDERRHIRRVGPAAVGLVPDLQPRARELDARPAVCFAERHHADAANVEDDLFACEFGLEVEEVCLLLVQIEAKR